MGWCDGGLWDCAWARLVLLVSSNGARGMIRVFAEPPTRRLLPETGQRGHSPEPPL
jgi:hypothetical protein